MSCEMPRWMATSVVGCWLLWKEPLGRIERRHRLPVAQHGDLRGDRLLLRIVGDL
jgi:hypothetical protein